MAQARRVGDLLQAADPGLAVQMVEVTTSGDRDRRSPITELTELGAFVRAIQECVLASEADLAVHALKDLPTRASDGLALVAIPERGSPNDVLVGGTLAELSVGARVGTGSPRRAEQLCELRPDLQPVELRGNVDTRLRKVAAGEVDAAVMAEAGLERLGESARIAQRLDPAQMVPAPGQGAIAVEALVGSEAAELAAAIDQPTLRPLLAAERLLVAEVATGCRSALGALAVWEHGRIRLDAFVADERGRRRARVSGDLPETVVAAVRRELSL
jgi:hydroxymethylbilane synthase